MFSTEEHEARFRLQTKTNKHGDEDAPAAVLHCSLTMHSSMLDQLHPALRQVYFCKPSSGQQSIAYRDGDDRTQIAIPEIKGFTWSGKYPGYALEVSVDIEASKPVSLAGLTLSKLQVSFIQGGSVSLNFQLSGEPTPDVIAKLYAWQEKDVLLTITPPSVTEREEDDDSDAQGDMLGQGEGEQSTAGAAAAAIEADEQQKAA